MQGIILAAGMGKRLKNLTRGNSMQFKPGDWYAVQKDVRVVSNWSRVSENSVLP